MRAITALFALSLLSPALAGCGPYPRDSDGTLERIERSGTIRVGMTQIDPQDGAVAQAYLARIERAAGAKAMLEFGPAERQLAALEHGELDLVIGEFAGNSPWLHAATVIEPLTVRAAGERTIGLAPVAANGEHRWVMLLEREVRAMHSPKLRASPQ